ncbi:RanBP1 domain protein [Ancylostoma ceylanicum]|uniref:RanBP1 domain protein n=1 Tax=Ancylostoma ceylanicum TaxID=53326 RepID=A0A0D6LHU7_9BILA|nr:RanBP1 domain protein [Ancylostoma ceylanicum]
MSEQSNNDSGAPPPAKKMFAFRQSALAAKADQLWNQIAVMTGEENDINIFQTACKLHSFDKEKKTWVERGLSQIRINQRNEDGEVHHRIVARTTGNHRVVINSKVHADMLFERVDAKRLKISATSPDSNAMQIFLKTALNIDELCNILDGLIKKEKATEASKRKRKACEEPGEEKVAKMKIQEDDESKESDCSAEQKLPESSPPVNSPASKEDKKDEKEDNKESPQQEQSPEKTEKVTASSE